MKKNLMVLLLTLTTMVGASAAVITESRAREMAGQFFNVEMPQGAVAQQSKLKVKGAASAYYIFNNPSQPGWVVIAGDDRARQVLAYGDECWIDDDNDVPPAMQEVLDDFARQISAAATGDEQPSPAPLGNVAATTKTRIPMMLSCKWAQGAPFNAMCPVASSGSNCVAGCVAIAMAQLMYYYKSTTPTTEIPEYTAKSLNVVMPALEPTQFNFDIMNDWYDDAASSTASAQEVQKLVLYCGQAAQMNYTASSSGATSDRNAFVSYFGYDPGAQQINREDMTSAEWEDLIYTELANGRPVFFSAHKLNGGHAFLCDGYDGNGLYHINWGWRGSKNGYFALNAMSDGNSGGTGAAQGDEAYSLKLAAIVGMQPSTGTATTNGNNATLHGTISAFDQTTYTRTSSAVDFTDVKLRADYWNISHQAFVYDFGWSLYDSDGNVVKTQVVLSNKTLNGTYYTYPTASLSFGKGITAGTYYLKPVGRIAGTQEFHPLRGTGVNYVIADITSTTLNLTVVDALGAQNLKVNSVTAGSTKMVGSPMELTLDVTNSGLTDYNYIYMWVDGTVVSATTTDVAIGATGKVAMIYTPSAAGTKTFMFTADKEGTKELYSTSFAVSASTSHSFSGSCSSSLAGTTATVKATLKNNGSAAYNNYIVARLYKKRPNSGNTGYLDNSVSKSLSLASGKSSTLTFEFANLEIGGSYFVTINYYSNGSLVKTTSTSSFTVASPYNAHDVNQDGAVTSSDVTAIYGVLTGTNRTYQSYCDLNNDGSITAADITALYSYMLGN